MPKNVPDQCSKLNSYCNREDLFIHLRNQQNQGGPFFHPVFADVHRRFANATRTMLCKSNQ